MRAMFGVLGLLITLAIVGVLAKKQISSLDQIKVPEVAGLPAAAQITVDPKASQQQQAQQIQQQVKTAVDAAIQQPRAEPQDK